jgi:hypothetical protein
MSPVEVKYEGTEYVGYFFSKPITKGKSLEKVVKKLYNYIKSQS